MVLYQLNVAYLYIYIYTVLTLVSSLAQYIKAHWTVSPRPKYDIVYNY